MADITPENFAEILISELRKYTTEKSEKIIEVAEKIGRKSLRKIKHKSPRLTGDYKKGWAFKILKKTPTNIQIRIYQKGKEARLTDLLEKGHESRRAGRRVAPIPHIQPIEDEANAELDLEISRILREE